MALAAVLCVAGGFAAEGNKLVPLEQSVQENSRLGVDAVSQIRSDYSAGRYNDFLRAMDVIYGEALEKEAGELHVFNTRHFLAARSGNFDERKPCGLVERVAYYNRARMSDSSADLRSRPRSRRCRSLRVARRH